MLPPPGDGPAGRSAYWSVFFGVADVDAAAARATTLGGTIGSPPRDTPLGRLTTLHDPQGARFSLLQTGTGRGSRSS
jgi:predicted enzyme related to lactoylglutathione lyase